MSEDTTQPVTPESIPEVAGEPPVDPTLLGKMEPQEQAQLGFLRQRTEQITMEIGQLEVRKARMLGALDATEQQAQQVLAGVAKRLGIAEGTPCRIAPDGTIRTTPEAPPKA